MMSNKELWLQQLNLAKYQAHNDVSNMSAQIFKTMSNHSFNIGYQGGQFKIRTDGLGYSQIRTSS
jgi:hypothetical protein